MINIYEHPIWTSTKNSYLEFIFDRNILKIQIICIGLRGPYNMKIHSRNRLVTKEFSNKMTAIDYFKRILPVCGELLSEDYYSTELDIPGFCTGYNSDDDSYSPIAIAANPEQIQMVMSRVNKPSSPHSPPVSPTNRTSGYSDSLTSSSESSPIIERKNRRFKLNLSGILSLSPRRRNSRSPKTPDTPTTPDSPMGMITPRTPITRRLSKKFSPKGRSLSRRKKHATMQLLPISDRSHKNNKELTLKKLQRSISLDSLPKKEQIDEVKVVKFSSIPPDVNITPNNKKNI